MEGALEELRGRNADLENRLAQFERLLNERAESSTAHARLGAAHDVHQRLQGAGHGARR